MPANHPVIFFDGHCRLCSGSVSFVIRRDRKNIFRFAPLQSGAGQSALEKLTGIQQSAGTIVYAEGEKVYTRSTAILKILKRMGGGWQLLYAFIVVPRFLRDPVYDFLARNRYKWFGRRDSCMIVPPGRGIN